MNAAATPSNAFTAHLLASDKREWSITVAGVPFVLVRTEPTARDIWLDTRATERVDTWTLFVLTTDGEREQVAREQGMWMTPDPSGRRPTVAQHTAFRLARCMEAAAIFAEGLTRLTVMMDNLVGNVADTAPVKVLKLRNAAAMALRTRRVLSQDNGMIVSVVAGDAVLIVAKQHPGGWNELTYRVGDRAVHGSFNLVYTGTITSISPKTITVTDRNRTKRMSHDRFVGRNTQTMDSIDSRNADTMMSI
jgi:hypothetical protein